MIKFINREQLYKEVWSEPFRKLYTKFLISIPQMGHWQKIALGHIIETPPLPNYKSFILRTNKKKAVSKKVNSIYLAPKLKSLLSQIQNNIKLLLNKLSRDHILLLQKYVID